MVSLERIFYTYAEAHEARGSNDVLIQEELVGSTRRYIVLSQSNWSELRKGGHERTLHIVHCAGGEE